MQYACFLPDTTAPAALRTSAKPGHAPPRNVIVSSDTLYATT